MSALTSTHDQNLQLAPLLGSLGELIRQARRKALRAVDTLQVQTCWQIGRHIVEFEQEGAERAAYGKRLLPTLAKLLTAEFGKGIDVSNLRYMRLFYHAFPKCDALRHELSWTHYRLLLRVENNNARQQVQASAAERRRASHRTGSRAGGTGGAPAQSESAIGMIYRFFTLRFNARQYPS